MLCGSTVWFDVMFLSYTLENELNGLLYPIIIPVIGIEALRSR